jgi:hypothetical protein
MNFLKKILQLNRYQLGAQFFVPVLASGILYFLDLKLTAFIVFQFFIEIFVLWHFSIGLSLSDKALEQRARRFFVFNMLFAFTYRMSSNGYQIWYRMSFGIFPELEQMLWLIPIHLYATFGSVYCFYLNSKWITSTEARLKLNPIVSLWRTFWQILIFPIGLWYVQPRLNRIGFALSRENEG